MMAKNILIGLGAGLATALLFASVISGTTLALPLYLLSPLPIAIAGIGFGTWSGAAAAGLSATVIGALFGPMTGLMQLAIFGGPVAWGAHLAGLSRPAGDAPDAVEWFPLSDVLLRLALAVAVGTGVMGLIVGLDPSTAAPLLAKAIGDVMTANGTTLDAAGQAELDQVVGIFVAVIPAMVGYSALGTAVLNLWLGGHIARMSGLLARGWTPMWTVVLPASAAIALAVAVVAAVLLPGAAGRIALACSGALAFAFALTGFGAVHALLHGRPGRFAILFLLYLLSLVIWVPVLGMAVLGIVDSLTRFRHRRLAGGTGPSS